MSYDTNVNDTIVNDTKCHKNHRPYLAHAALSFLGHESGELKVIVQDGIEEHILVFSVERRLADQHLKEEDTEGPPVHRRRVFGSFQNLRQNCKKNLKKYMYDNINHIFSLL